MAATQACPLAQAPTSAYAFNRDRPHESRLYSIVTAARPATHPGRGIRDRGQLELEGCAGILQGWERLERYRGSCHLTPQSDLPMAVQRDKVITFIDWAPNSDRTITASQDQNACVWTQTLPRNRRLGWKPTLVLLNINREATFVCWSPFGNNLAVSTGAGYELHFSYPGSTLTGFYKSYHDLLF